MGRAEPDWLSLGAASRLLGVSTATIRRWADSGRVKTFTTPGGHRRFQREALVRMLPADRARRPDLAGGGLTPARLTSAYRRRATRGPHDHAWLSALSSGDREAFRVLGRKLAWALVAYLDADGPETRRHHLAEATAVAADYGRMGPPLRLSMSDVVEGFLAFRRPFLAEMAQTARRRGFDAAETSSLHDDADRAMDRLLIAALSGYTIEEGRHRRADRRLMDGRSG